jgi:hypothetical protein
MSQKQKRGPAWHLASDVVNAEYNGEPQPEVTASREMILEAMRIMAHVLVKNTKRIERELAVYREIEAADAAFFQGGRDE